MPNKARLKFFDKDVIKWTGQYLLHDFYKVLLNLRKDHPALRSGDLSIQTRRLHTTADESILAFVREKGVRKVLVILNLSNNAKLKFSLLDVDETNRFESIFSGLDLYIDKDTVFEMQEWEYLVYVK
jgi:glycosidase